LELRARYRLGTARLRAFEAWRRLLGRLRPFPSSAPVVPRPKRLRGGRRLVLTHALVASDLNARYLDFWPLARRAWTDVVDLEPLLVLVAEEADAPAALLADPGVRLFPPLAGVHTALQAQCIRLLYPALLETDGAVVTSDIDMVPLNRSYFTRPASRVGADDFVAYRDVILANGEIPICYNAARPATWRTILGVETPDGVRARLADWTHEIEYEGSRGGVGWARDQHILYRILVEHGRRTPNVWILDDAFTGFRRLERESFRKPKEIAERERRRIRRGAYSDFHCLAPYDAFREVNDLVVDLAVDGLSRR
jgi:hypothetical protein